MGPLGHAFVLASMFVAVGGALAAVYAAKQKSDQALVWARRLAYLFAALTIGANVAMEVALLTHDFSVEYVAMVGSRASPTWVTIVSLWSSLNGSLLLWAGILGGFIAVYLWRRGAADRDQLPWALAVMLACGAFFAWLIAFPANPFKTLPMPPLDGPGPNPLLQNHILMVVHPPLLYLGYVGMVVPFGLACAALLNGKLGREQVRSLRVWLLVPWTFLTLGIVMGGWWAYEVLGWGGYWAWDPVENASLLPWLTATAAAHSILTVERRGMLKGWTVTLVIATFLLTVLGTFMTRSGVFNSVHSFTQSDIGPTFLVFLAVAFAFSVLLLASRISLLEEEGKLEDGRSREGAVLLNNLILVMLTLTVLIGTVFPLIVEAVRGVKMSVGEPYFNRMTIPLGVALLFLLGVGPALPWGRPDVARVKRALALPLIGGVLLAGLGLVLGARGWLLATLFTGGYALQVTFHEMLRPVFASSAGAGAGLGLLFTKGRRRFGAYVIHAGVAMILVAVGVSTAGKVTTEVSLRQGESAPLGRYTMTFLGSHQTREPHRTSSVARVAVSENGRPVATLEPRLNYFNAQREPIGTPSVSNSVREDIYLSVVSFSADGSVIGLRAFVNPMVIWIWIGTVISALGALIALWPRQATRPAVATRQPPVAAAPPAAGQEPA